MPYISSIIKFLLYADDTTGLHSGPTLENVFQEMSSELSKVSSWFQANNLTVNATKTYYVTFLTYQKERHVNFQSASHTLTLNNIAIKNANCVRFLGFLLDKNLTFKNHLEHVCSKLLKGIYALSRAAQILPTNELKIIYSALILPYLHYGLLSWGGKCKIKTPYYILHSGNTC